MIFRQLYDAVSGTYTYLLGGKRGGEALLIDPVLEKIDRYLMLLRELDLRLVKALDTHVHADHVTALGALRDRTRCITVMGRESAVDRVSVRVADGESIEIEGVQLEAWHTPGHTNDSYCFVMPDRVFTGDTLLIRGTGRTDFQNGDASKQYDSLFNRLLQLPEETLVYPGHDYKGDTVSTIGEEKAWNPRLQVASREAYIALMQNLKLPNPRMMDVAVPANLRIGLAETAVEAQGWSVAPEKARVVAADWQLVDLRDASERKRHGVIAGAAHVPYPALDRALEAGGTLRSLAASGRRLLFYCAHGERSAMAVEAARKAGLMDAFHLQGGIEAWAKSGGAVEKTP
ncbi:MAG: MBL fold metallo-hydrolase [Alphaproteobacteria bacterium]|nr:MBL fold metallo-hydrolase [Alphaproteobacteria bacterium]